MFMIDGTEYDGVYCTVDAINESFTLLEGLGSQRLQSNALWYDIVGTEVAHTVTFRRGSCSLENWEALWATLREPVASHSFTFPDGKDGTVTYNGHIEGGARDLLFIDSDGNNHWGDYSITIIPISPQY